MKVKELLSDPKKWCKGAYARTEDGKPVSETDHDATKFCLLGALYRCYTSSPQVDLIRKKLCNYLWEKYEYTPMAFNDSPNVTHEVILSIVNELDI